LLSPEVEVTKSLSSNLYKWNYMNSQSEEKRVIDSNTLIEKRISEMASKMLEEQKQGFVGGLNADVIDVLLQDMDEAGEASGNVIKANENAEAVAEQAAFDAEAIIAEAYAEAERIKSEAGAIALSEKNRVLAEARSMGYAEGLEKAKRENEQLQNELKKKAMQLEAEYQEYINELEPQFVDTITGIYEHIFHVELEAYREILAYLISATLRKSENSRQFMIHVSQEDYPYVSMQKKQIVSGIAATNSSVEIVEDLTLSRNECLIETEGGIFDCSLGTQLAELGQKIRLLSYEKEKR